MEKAIDSRASAHPITRYTAFVTRLLATKRRCDRCGRAGAATKGDGRGAEVWCQWCDTPSMARRSAARRAIDAATRSDTRSPAAFARRRQAEADLKAARARRA